MTRPSMLVRSGALLGTLILGVGIGSFGFEFLAAQQPPAGRGQAALYLSAFSVVP